MCADDRGSVLQQPPSCWATPPSAVAEADIIETIDSEVVVVGAGLAGTAAALSAAEHGAKVVVIEKGMAWSGRGGGIGVFESRMMREAGINLDKPKIAREWMERCGNRVNERLVWLFLDESGNAMDWWLDKAEAAGLKGFLWGGYYRGDAYTEYPCYHMFFGDPSAEPPTGPGARLAQLCYGESVKAGVRYFFETPGEQLFKVDGRVAGVTAKGRDGYRRFRASKGVVLATGDIGGNPEMCRELAPNVLRASNNVYEPAGQNTGDGHRMGVWAGGALQEAPFPIIMHPQAFAETQYCFLFVNARGERFMNEDTWVQAKSLQLLRQPVGCFAYAIFDSKWPEYVRQTLPYGGGMCWDSFRPLGAEWSPDRDRAMIESYVEKGEWGWKADTLDDLAAKIGVPAGAFLAAVARLNELTKKREDLDFGKRPELLFPIEDPPFYAMKFGPLMLGVVGGLSVDTKLRVLDAARNPVPGLFAVGSVSGDLYGQDYPIHLAGNSHGRCLTWGYLVGRAVNEQQEVS
jgi:fumarate reductase flavoprotein subunit